MLGQAAIYGVFSLMSIITGQFFLKQINEELKTINKKLDDILRFMYGDKKAELLSEVSFVKYACDNYVYIMEHDVQRTATIISIQEAKKVATKDIEFYLNDLHNEVKSGDSLKAINFDKFNKLFDKIQKIKENLNLSLQLYLMSSLIEIYYAQNFEESYMEYLAKDIKIYAKNYNDQIFSHYGFLISTLNRITPTNAQKADRDKLMATLEKEKSSHGEIYDDICDRISDVSKALNQQVQYYLDKEGNVYYVES